MDLVMALSNLSYETVYDTNDRLVGYRITGLKEVDENIVDMNDIMDEVLDGVSGWFIYGLSSNVPETLFANTQSIERTIKEFKEACQENTCSEYEAGECNHCQFFGSCTKIDYYGELIKSR